MTTEIILAILGSSTVSAVAVALINRGKTSAEAAKIKAEIKDQHLDRLERRQTRLEKRIDRYEIRDAIQQSALNCAHKCDKPDEDCPVLQYLHANPLPSVVVDTE